MSLRDFRQAGSKPALFEGLLGLLAALRAARSGLAVRQVERPQNSQQHPSLAVADAPALLHSLAQIDNVPTATMRLSAAAAATLRSDPDTNSRCTTLSIKDQNRKARKRPSRPDPTFVCLSPPQRIRSL